MAPPAGWRQGWTGQPPAPPGSSTLTPFSLVLVRVNGAGPWIGTTLGNVGPNDTGLELAGGTWGQQAPGLPVNTIVLAIP